jgi:hypothetical protein
VRAASTADVKNLQAPLRSDIGIEDDRIDSVVRAIRKHEAGLHKRKRDTCSG